MRPMIFVILVLIALSALPEPASAGWNARCSSTCNGRTRVGVGRCCRNQGWGNGYCHGGRAFCILVINIPGK